MVAQRRLMTYPSLQETLPTLLTLMEDYLLDGDPRSKHTCLPVLAKHQVCMVQGSSTSHMCPLLTIVGHVEGDPALGMKGPGLG